MTVNNRTLFVCAKYFVNYNMYVFVWSMNLCEFWSFHVTFQVEHERDFCTPSKLGTHAVTLTKYLKRFISVKVRCKLTLKEKSKSGHTLMANFHRVYLFLIDVLRAGYRICGKYITGDESHTALRTIWGRSKQMKNVDEAKKTKLKHLRETEKKSGRRRRH